jgi:hypothetical protein
MMIIFFLMNLQVLLHQLDGGTSNHSCGTAGPTRTICSLSWIRSARNDSGKDFTD